ncbi:MAG: division/cell wall cluster transcriptional repressor MraZ [Candidatus Hydrogenedentes bacterium]|nr:division/cell wall cluster transcriptional repressor MraZ [Candidatus Hydrogenedentota bacterium]
MYFGEALTKLDDKGRITVPRRVRETMDVNGHAVWYMTRGFDHCIFVFHRDSWNGICAHANRYSSMNAEALDFRRLFIGSVAEVKPDGQGRMAVPPHLREHAGLDKDAVLIGVDDHLELWNPETWRAFRESKEAGYKEMAAPLFAQESVGAAVAEKGGQGNGC